MPATRFICPDGVEIPIQSCYLKCRMEHRCLTQATLRAIGGSGESHAWDGVPHVTSLMNGQMYEYLRHTVDYAVDPRDSAFALLGTQVHAKLEAAAGGLGEIKLRTSWVQGTTDSVEVEDGEYTLNDYKTWGSYRVARALGIVKVGRDQFIKDPDKADLRDVTLQTNIYRLMFQQQFGLEITRINCQITVRDHGIKVAMDRGVLEQMYLVPIPLLDPAEVINYFLPRATAIMKVMAGDQPPLVCTPEERWDNRRCMSYCPVAEHCPHGISLGVKHMREVK